MINDDGNSRDGKCGRKSIENLNDGNMVEYAVPDLQGYKNL